MPLYQLPHAHTTDGAAARRRSRIVVRSVILAPKVFKRQRPAQVICFPPMNVRQCRRSARPVFPAPAAWEAAEADSSMFPIAGWPSGRAICSRPAAPARRYPPDANRPGHLDRGAHDGHSHNRLITVTISSPAGSTCRARQPSLRRRTRFSHLRGTQFFRKLADLRLAIEIRTIIVRNHEIPSQAGELSVAIAASSSELCVARCTSHHLRAR
jgi:hypothetical protein